jgi:hypothetical protein
MQLYKKGTVPARRVPRSGVRLRTRGLGTGQNYTKAKGFRTLDLEI